MIPIIEHSKYEFSDNIDYKFVGEKGLSEETVKNISKMKREPEWMLQNRLAGFKHFTQKNMPQWGPDLSGLNLNEIVYFAKAAEKKDEWEEVPEKIKDTFKRLGVSDAEKSLGGLEAQYDSEAIYGHIKEELKRIGVIFCDMDTAVREYPEIVKKYFGTVVPFGDNMFASLNTAAWSGGSFIYVPKNTTVEFPLQAYFRINTPKMGQFERTLIIVEEGSRVHYVEGCSAAKYYADALHAAVVEIVAHKNSYVRYTTLQNWSKDVYNLVTKRAHAYENSTVEWVDANVGSKVSMKYPSVYLMEPKAKAEFLSIAFASKGQQIDTGAKIIHLAPNTSSRIVSKSISTEGGRSSYRGFVHVSKNSKNVKVSSKCDALLMGEGSRSDTYPCNEIHEKDVSFAHEATVGKISDDQIFYLQSKGLSRLEAETMIVQGFLSPFTKELPLEYAIEFNRLVNLEMKDVIG